MSTRDSEVDSTGSEKSLRAYRFVQWLLKLATRVFFRRIEVTGRETLPDPDQSAVLFCGNHPNSLLDPVLITAWCGRVVHFAAKDVLFDPPVFGSLLRLMGAVPIRRRRDHGGGSQDNSDAFRELKRTLREGRAMGIFPEGISHDESQLAPLKTGAVRIALGALQEGAAKPIYIVPVGLNYFTRNRFRSSVLIQFGEPILIEGETTGEEDRERVREHTAELDTALRSLTINAETWETLWVLDGVRRLYQPEGIKLAERARLARRFNAVYPEIRQEPEIRSMYDRVRGYLVRLSADNLDDRIVARGITPLQIAGHIVEHAILIFISLPLFALGAPVFVPLLILLKLAGVYVAPRSDTVASTKFLLGFLLVLLLYAGGSVWAFWSLGLWGGAAIATLIPLCGMSVVHVLSRLDAIRHVLLTSWRVLHLRRELAELRQERALLVTRVAKIAEEHKAMADELTGA
jgi:1-acyl-sn-glycerol-3-phosphate acyltransferase